MKKIISLSVLFVILLVFSGTWLFLSQFPKHELATFSASIGNAEDCESGGSDKFLNVGNLLWWYFQLPGVSQSFVDEGNNFVGSAFNAMICKQGQPGYAENTRRIRRLVLHGMQYGQSIDFVGENRFSLMHGAVINSDLSLIRFLVSEGADPATLTRYDAVWKRIAYGKKTPYEFALGLRDHDWPVSDDVVAFLQDLEPK